MALDATKKKVLIFSAIFLAIIGLVFGIANLVSHLTTPNNHNEARYGVYGIRMVGWENPADRQFNEWAAASLPELNRLGPTFRIVTSNENIVVVRGNLVQTPDQCGTLPGLVYQVDTATRQQRIIIDPVCTHGEFEFRAAFMHEVGHSLGMGHVCRSADTGRADCSSVGHATAVMNPNLLTASREGDEFSTPTVGPLPEWIIQPLDIKEFCRVKGCN